MIFTKQALPDDPAPLDCPPAYEAVGAHATSHDEKHLEPSSSSSPSKYPSTFSSIAKGKGKASSSWFSFISSKTTRQVQTTVLTLIRDLVKEQSQDSAGSLAILESCVEACKGYHLSLSAILQLKSIEGHTPMYWAIVKRAPDTDADNEEGEGEGYVHGRGRGHAKAVPDLLTALISYATPLNPTTIADIRHACLLTSDQLLFQRLRMSPEFSPLSGTDEMLLGASIPPDAIAVENVLGGNDEGAFTVNFEIAHFQKRMLISKRVQLDFIARGISFL
ncbi:hypothetical protein C0992_011514 [Termitomyces sp. T32_za158]|nr:hypothetical protein C0992_011514 [Termitomyces sp. T32_za158]